MGRLRPETLTACGVQLPNDTLIETGTCAGMGVRYCSPHFKTVHTIELDRVLYELAKGRLRSTHVQCWHGSSPVVLRELIEPDRDTTFFLDAHYVASRDEPSVGPQCPLIDELAAIFAFNWSAPMRILIDDAPMFGKKFWRYPRKCNGYNRADWPTLEQIEQIAAGQGKIVRNVADRILVME